MQIAFKNNTNYPPFGSSFNSMVSGLGTYKYDYQGDYAEKDQELNLNSFDLRMYDARLGRWLTTDPLSAHMNQLRFSPYSAMWNNPISYVDPDGACPECGDEELIHGGTLNSITINGNNTVSNRITWGDDIRWQLDNKQIIEQLQWKDAKAHFQFGGGTPLNIELNSIDLSKVSLSDFNNKGLATIRLDTYHFSSINDALIHGTITLQLLDGTNKAKIALNSGKDFPELKNKPAGMYNFEMQSLDEPINWLRNPATFFGGLINGTSSLSGVGNLTPIFIYTGGIPYPIYYHGTVIIR